ncbi:MAG: class I SAM-dependent methyltransferase [Oscillospiraceae bacterium]|jgi:hypothetical protein|nr:class I SAM-dependent methyltransferase [Oscillospiraceae bacterium]
MSEKQVDGISYAAAKLTACGENIARTADFMARCRADVEKYRESDKPRARDRHGMLVAARDRLVEHVTDSRLPLLELGGDALADYAGELASQLAAFNVMTKNYAPLTATLNAFADKLPGANTTNAAVLSRQMNTVRMGYYPTDLANVEHILRGIAFPNGVVTNLLDPCCGEGDALKKLAVGNNCMTYGIELDEGRADAAQDELHRVGFGSFFHSRISRDAFHLLFLNPPYLAVMTAGGDRARDEKRFLVESIPHLMPGGLLVYIVPYYRLTADVCRVIADNFADISVSRFTDDEFKKHRQVAVLGTRIKRIDGKDAADALAESAFTPDKLPCVTELAPGRYALPAKPKTVEMFKGAVFNEVELARQLKASKSFDALLQNKSASEGVHRPPLPFSIAQLGLIGGSGLINGLIECDTPHIIKGRVVKTARTTATTNRDDYGNVTSEEIKETISNKMIFNILTPEGFKSLA